MSKIISRQVKPGIEIHHIGNNKFNTIVLKLFFIRKLDEDTTKASVLSKVLKRGTSNYPTTIELKKAFESNYGTVFTIKVKKVGEHHLFEVTIFMPDKKILGEEKGAYAFNKNIDLLFELIFNPLQENNKLDKIFVKQEKKALSDEIQSIYNDKEQWALRRCIEISCKGELYSMPSSGKLEDIEDIDSDNLTSFYQELIDKSPIELYIAGDVKKEDLSLLETKFLSKFSPRKKIDYDKQNTIKNISMKEIFEYDEINQGKLVISLRTNVSPCSKELPAYVLYNAILGGGTYSKLFKIVREENSLAYYVHSFSDRNKMMSFIEAGINKENYDKSKELILEIINDLQQGNITKDELNQARDAIINSLWSREDFAGGSINHHIMGVLSGCPTDTEKFEKDLLDVNLESVIKVANSILVDTIYFLSSENGGELDA